MNLVVPRPTLVVPQGTVPPKREFKFDTRRGHAEEMLALLKPAIDGFDLFYGAVLIGKYIRTEIGTGVLEAAPQTQLEDQYQGKVGLVLKIGELAFKSGPGRDFGTVKLNVGDWAVYHSSAGQDIDIRTSDGMSVVHCRILQDAEITGRVQSPDTVW